MSKGSEPVTFSVVKVHRREVERPQARDTDPDPGNRAQQARALPEMGQVRADPLGEAFYEGDRFPLAGPIIQQATRRQLRGKCSQCESRLRLKVKGPGPVTVRCPICGNRKQVSF